MAELFRAGSDKELLYYLLVCHKEEHAQALEALKPFSASTVNFKEFTGTPGENIAAIDGELDALRQERAGRWKRKSRILRRGAGGFRSRWTA